VCTRWHRHVEIKFAMRMRAWHDNRRPGEPPLNETIVIDRPPYGAIEPGGWTCHAQLSEWLPPGASYLGSEEQ
jgi:hypothetical protein